MATERRLCSAGWLWGSFISLIIAGLLILLVRGTHGSGLVPVVFIVVVVLCARYFGAIAGIVASIAATLLFAFLLFEPYADFKVKDAQALLNLGLLLFAGIALSYANADHDEDGQSTHHTLNSQ